MAVIHQALLTWFLLAIFVVLLIIKLDEKADVNWFIVFTPMYFFDIKLLTFLMFKLVSNTRRRNGPTVSLIEICRKRGVFLSCLVFKFLFQIMLCLKLQYFQESIPWFIVMSPFWALMITLSSSLVHILITGSHEPLNLEYIPRL